MRKILSVLILISILVTSFAVPVLAQDNPPPGGDQPTDVGKVFAPIISNGASTGGGMMGGGDGQEMPDMSSMKRTTQAERVAAAQRAKAARAAAEAAGLQSAATNILPGQQPDYFGIYPNWAQTELPTLDANGNALPGTGVRKFINRLPGLGAANANEIGQYISVATPDITTYPGSDYYVIASVEYTETMHADLPPTKLRGYVQLSTATNPGQQIPLFNPNGTPVLLPDGTQAKAFEPVQYLGPLLIGQRDRPVRVLYRNLVPTNTIANPNAANLMIPVDVTSMGAGAGPNGGITNPNPQIPQCSVLPKPHNCYSENRSAVHLHGAKTPWISDGTAHQWISPAGETSDYLRGVSVQNVPDMPDPGPGAETIYYSNQQSSRLMFYHDHSYGITRLGVYVGEAAGYVLRDTVEQELINNHIIPGAVAGEEIPLMIQDKSFVPPSTQLLAEDPTWDVNRWGSEGSLWFPHVYMPNQNPYDLSGANAMGRWDYGPWFWPPYTGLAHGAIPNAYANLAGEPPYAPGTPWTSLTPESFMDTPLVNGQPYPYLNVEPKAYRFRILNASNDRYWNLQLYTAASDGTMWNPDGTLADGAAGEVPMVPAITTPGFPDTWPTDNREGGVPDFYASGPEMIQIGSESGFLAWPAILPNNPVNYVYNRRDIVVLNVSDKTLMLGPAMRADVVVDFSQYAGKNLILYNDSPAPVPASDPRLDYFTGDTDHSLNGDGTGGAPTTIAGYGPNTRTIMQIRVAAAVGGGTATVERVQITNGGQDYTAMPIVSFTGGGGTGAAAHAVGTVETVAVSNAGSGYSPNATVQFTGASCIGASATPVVKNGQIIGVTVLNGGTGCTGAPSVAIFDVVGGTGSGASAVALMAVTDVLMDSHGAGYSKAPEVDLLGGSGYGAAAASFLSSGTPYNVTALNDAFTHTPLHNGVFERTQEPIIVPQAEYDLAYGQTFPMTNVVRIQDNVMTFKPMGAAQPLTLDLQPKAIQELFEVDYGRMNATLGVELPNTNVAIQTTIPLGYADPSTEILQDSITPLTPRAGDGTQLWKITHNGVDTHAIHFHLMDVQVINRVGWDGAIRLPDANEIGWKETVSMNPLEDAIVAMRPTAPQLEFGVPNSIRPLNPAIPIGSGMGFTNIDPVTGQPVTVLNQMANYSWEYVWHCHLLGHEENDMMRPLVFNVVTRVPTTAITLSGNTTGATPQAPLVNLSWTDPTPKGAPTTPGNPQNEIGFRLERATGAAGAFAVITTQLANLTSYVDTAVGGGTTYRYRVSAFNTAGQLTSNVISIDTPSNQVPPTPTGFAATVQTGPQIRLTWNQAQYATGYILKRSGGTAVADVPITGGATLSYTDSRSIQYGVTYTYQLIAVNSGNSTQSAAAQVVVSVPLPTPANLRVLTRTTNSISLSWNSVTAAGLTIRYEMQRSTDGVNFTSIANNLSTTSYTSTGLTTRTTYYYRVRAYSTSTPAVYSNWSNIVSQRTN